MSLSVGEMKIIRSHQIIGHEGLNYVIDKLSLDAARQPTLPGPGNESLYSVLSRSDHGVLVPYKAGYDGQPLSQTMGQAGFSPYSQVSL